MYSQCGSDYIGADTMGKMLFDSQKTIKSFENEFIMTLTWAC